VRGAVNGSSALWVESSEARFSGALTGISQFVVEENSIARLKNANVLATPIAAFVRTAAALHLEGNSQNFGTANIDGPRDVGNTVSPTLSGAGSAGTLAASGSTHSLTKVGPGLLRVSTPYPLPGALHVTEGSLQFIGAA